MRILLAAFFVASCGTSPPDAHELVACDGWSPAPASGQCELACESPPPAPTQNAPFCDTAWLPHCEWFVAFDGTKGCCFPKNIASPEIFWPCL